MATGTMDIGSVLDEGPWRGAQTLFVLLTALTIVVDGVDNQLLPPQGFSAGLLRTAGLKTRPTFRRASP